MTSLVKNPEYHLNDVIIAAMMNKHKEEKKMILEKKVIEPWFMGETFMRGYKPYSYICRASLKAFFTNVPYRIFQYIVEEFYINLKILGKTLISPIKNVKIRIHRESFRRIFEILFLGTPYKPKKP